MVGLVRRGRWREEARKSTARETIFNIGRVSTEVVVEVYQVGCLVRMPSLEPQTDSEVVLGITHPWRLKDY